jgi:hypothetical protein
MTNNCWMKWLYFLIDAMPLKSKLIFLGLEMNLSNQVNFLSEYLKNMQN